MTVDIEIGTTDRRPLTKNEGLWGVDPSTALRAGGGLRTAVLVVIPCLLAGVVYVNALNNPFVYDDYRTIIDNGSLVDLRDLRSIVWHDITRPLVNLSYAIDRRLWGPEPFGFHVTSVLLHMLNVGLLFHLVRRLAGDRNRRLAPLTTRPIQPEAAAFAAASLFGVHPLMTEAVGYISGRSEVLCAALFLGALLAGRRWMRMGGAAWWLLTLLLWIAAILAKETGVILPFVLLAMDRLLLNPVEANRRRRLLRLHAPFLGIAALGALARIAVFLNLEQAHGLRVRWSAMFDAAIVLWRYLRLLVLPTGQSIFHEIVPVTTPFEPRAMLSVVGLALVLTVAWQARRRCPIASLGFSWFLLLLLPSSALMVLDPSGDMAEHRIYLASAGPFLMTGAFIGWLASRPLEQGASLRWVAAMLLAPALLSLSGRTLLRNAIWASPVTLWSEAVERAPDHWLPRTVLGESLHAAGRHEEAVAAHRAALAKRPGDETIYMKLGLCLAELGRFDKAAATFEELRTIKPESATAFAGLGIVAMMSGHPDEARSRFHEAIDRDSRDVMARQWLASLEENIAGNAAEALRLCEEIERLEPGGLGNAECIRRNRARLGR
jgi:Flp pilus assembly protein TadD